MFKLLSISHGKIILMTVHCHYYWAYWFKVVLHQFLSFLICRFTNLIVFESWLMTHLLQVLMQIVIWTTTHLVYLHHCQIICSWNSQQTMFTTLLLQVMTRQVSLRVLSMNYIVCQKITDSLISYRPTQGQYLHDWGLCLTVFITVTWPFFNVELYLF